MKHLKGRKLATITSDRIDWLQAEATPEGETASGLPKFSMVAYTGGAMTLTAGESTAASGTGGAVTVTAGKGAGATAGAGGAVSISGGIVMAPEDAESFPKLMENAKLAVRLVRSEAQSGHHGLGMGDSAPLPAHSHAG